MKKKDSMIHRRDVLICKIEDLDEKIQPKEQLMRDRGHGDVLEGQPNHRSLYTVYWNLYGSRSLSDLYAQRKSLQAKLKQCDDFFIKKEKEFNALLVNSPQISLPSNEEMNWMMPNDLKEQENERMAHEYFQRQEEEQWHLSHQYESL